MSHKPHSSCSHACTKRAKFCLQSPLQRAEEMPAKVGTHITGYDGVHNHVHDEVVKYGNSMKELHSKGLQGRNDWKMTSRNWATRAALISSSHTHRSRAMANSGCHLELWMLLMGRHRPSSQQGGAAQEMERGRQWWQQSPRLHSQLSQWLIHHHTLPSLTGHRDVSSCCCTDLITVTNQVHSFPDRAAITVDYQPIKLHGVT